MEAFSLLKYWKGTPTGGGNAGERGVNAKLLSTSCGNIPTTVVTAVNHRGAAEEENDGDDDSASDGDDGPFFDLEFAVPADVDEEDEEEEEMRQKVEERESVDEIHEVVEELEEHNNMSFSPSDDLFFKGKVIQINGSDAASALEMEEILHSAAAAAVVNSKSGQFPVPVSLVKSATKLRVFMLGLKRSKSESKQIPSEIIHRNNSKKSSSKFMTVRLKMEDVKTPIISLLTRATSNNTVKTTQDDEKSVAENDNTAADTAEAAAEEVEKKNKKEMVQKYLKLVRPLYVKVSNRKNNNQETVAGAAEEEVEKKETEAIEPAAARGGRRRLNLKVIAKKHLGKSKSAVVHSMPSSNSNNTTSSKKSDDSLFQQQDGIQSAILHCKRSFNSSSFSTSEDGEETTSVLMRSASDPSYEKKPAVVAEVVFEERRR